MSRIYTSIGPAVMNTTLFLEAFGQLTPGTAVINAEEEDLYSVFPAHAGMKSILPSIPIVIPLAFSPYMDKII